MICNRSGTMGSTSLVSLRSSVILCVLWLALAAEMEIDPVWENIFKARSDDDWRTVWHTERHRRCYHDLLIHMDWVCQKDIYAVKRKKKISEPFMDDQQAHRFLGRRRKRSAAHHALVKRGIIDECCHGSAGCSWEEYAEYCPANSRVRS
ncbi:putative insulin-like peptide 7 [Araneus ventricosus]|uniref:Putative insulin-like peptide 7 n=1 Tax=Araneus ventricosus TaxID=182803 RepID=A0A4Y2EK50_ARAVE|nr:putative insulin-like peptide 7 [Araneus ventricosus]